MVWSNLQWKAIILVKVLGSGRISWAREILGMGRSRRYVEHVKLRRLSGRVEIQGEKVKVKRRNPGLGEGSL